MVKSKPLPYGCLLAALPPGDCRQYNFFFHGNMPQKAFTKFMVRLRINYAGPRDGTLQQ